MLARHTEEEVQTIHLSFSYKFHQFKSSMTHIHTESGSPGGEKLNPNRLTNESQLGKVQNSQEKGQWCRLN